MPSRQLLDRFTDPDRSFAPIPLWWWSGDQVTDERIDWQLDQFAAGGVQHLVIINLAPRGPIVGGYADDPAWFSEAWWDRFEHTCESAASRGMKLWFYDQLGFPGSGNNIRGSLALDNPWIAGRKLVRTDLGQLDPEVITDLDDETFVGAYDHDGNRYGLGDLADLRRRGTKVELITSQRTSLDYLNPDAARLLFDYVHGEFERRVPQHLGTVIVGSFQDELPPVNTWTPRFAEHFAELKGYDLIKELPALFTGDDDRSAKIRTDYYEVRTALAEQAFFRPLGEWHDRYGMLLGADQSHPARSGWPTQSTQLYSDYFRTHRWYNAVGSDHNGDAKVHSSMAHLYGHDRVWMESFHSSGWGGTLEETYDWLIPFVGSGADLYNPHASYFGTFGGWFEWAPPSTDWRQPYWAHYPEFATAVARLCSVANWGSYVAEVALLHPATVSQALTTLDTTMSTSSEGIGLLGEDYPEVDRAQQLYIELAGEGNWFNPKRGALDSAGVPFDVIDDASIQAAELDADALAVRDQRYRTVLLPAATVLEPGTVAALTELLDAGGTVISIAAAPRLASGLATDEALITRLAEHPRLTRVDSIDAAIAVINQNRRWPHSDVPLLTKRVGDQYVTLVPAAWPSATEHIEGVGLRTVKKFDRGRYAERRTLTVPGPVTDVEFWDPATGERRPGTARPTEAGGHRIDVELAGAPALFVTWQATEPAAGVDHEPAGDHQRRIVQELTEWTGELIPTLDNRWGDLARPAGAALDRLQIWALDWAETTDPAAPRAEDWTPARVTFGQWLRTVGPVPSDQLPEPLAAGDAEAVRTGRQPLGADPWQRYEYSASRGRDRDAGELGNKGLVYEEFVRTPQPAAGESVQIRALISDAAPGPVDLVIGAAATKRVWWNGREVATDERAYHAIARVEVQPGANVLEYRLEAIERPKKGAAELGSFVGLAEPGGFAVPAQVVSYGPIEEPAVLTYRAEFSCPEGLRSAHLITGSHATMTVRLDGKVAAVQVRNELYEDLIGDEPRYFSHDVTELLGSGDHELELEVEAFAGAEFAYADLALRTGTSGQEVITTVATDGSWTVHGPDGERPATILPRHWGETASLRAARRPHPLPEANWMRGEAEVGSEFHRLALTDDLTPALQWYRIVLPSGAVAVTLPTAVEPESIMLDDASVRWRRTAEGLSLGEPLQRAQTLIIRLPARAFDRAGAAWRGPLQVTTAVAPLSLADWCEIGLAAWSGGVEYRSTVRGEDLEGALELDLGHLRGTVEVEIDGELVGTRFCGPYRFALGRRPVPFDLTVRVYNTLGPFLHESTPTMWVLPGQRESGLIGPVRLVRVG
ncbi:hypothetical protein [Microlunatus sp. GCM10028923]|uniref:hypothetical protein n=1 Tax=Microlunatus sp. GCM10028923 TaxID=3273400 RepID=UPI0036205E81